MYKPTIKSLHYMNPDYTNAVHLKNVQTPLMNGKAARSKQPIDKEFNETNVDVNFDTFIIKPEKHKKEHEKVIIINQLF